MIANLGGTAGSKSRPEKDGIFFILICRLFGIMLRIQLNKYIFIS